MAATLKLGDLIVNRLGFGAMRVCGTNVWGPPKDRDNAHRVLRRAIELGVNFFDTADSYGPHVDEELIAEALYPYPKDLARKMKIRPAQVALAWLLARSPVMLPIPGTKSVEHLEANVGAAGIALSDEDLKALS